jgi:adenosylhomocysteine nucleosidase
MPRISLPLSLALILSPLPLLAQDTSRIAVISAFEPEWIALQEDLQGAEETVINGNRFISGTLGGKEVVLFLSGISMVNAAMTTQLALDHFEISHIVFSGIAGGVDPSLSIGDVVVPEQWGQYLEGAFARETADGTFTLPSWMSSEFPNYGMMYTMPVEVARGGLQEPEAKFWFDVDPALLEVARGLAGSLSLEDCNEENACLADPPELVVGGHGVSGMTFVDNAAFREFVFDTFEARVLDMESAAVAHVAYANDVPFIAFRSLSDLAGGGEGENQMATFMSLASSNSASVVEAFLTALPDQ